MEAQSVAKIGDKKADSVKPMVVFVRGRLEKSRSYEGKRYSQILTPAPDAYSRPQLVEVRSKSKLGDVGEEVSVTCLLGGFARKAYQAKDKETGEVLTIVPVDHTLDAVDA